MTDPLEEMYRDHDGKLLKAILADPFLGEILDISIGLRLEVDEKKEKDKRLLWLVPTVPLCEEYLEDSEESG